MAPTHRIEETDLLRALRQPLSNVGYHVGVLAEGRAITPVRTRPARGSVQHFYRSNVEAPWALQVLGPGESDRSGTGEKPDGAPT
jgi:hypothetical protein